MKDLLTTFALAVYVVGIAAMLIAMNNVVDAEPDHRRQLILLAIGLTAALFWPMAALIASALRAPKAACRIAARIRNRP